MSPSLHRSDPAASARMAPETQATPNPDLLTVSEELGAIFSQTFCVLAASPSFRRKPWKGGRRVVVAGSRSRGARRALMLAGFGAGLLGLCLGALMEKSALLYRPQASDGTPIAAVALAPTPSPPMPSPPTPLPLTPVPSAASYQDPRASSSSRLSPAVDATSSASPPPSLTSTAASPRPAVRRADTHPLRLALLAAPSLRSTGPADSSSPPSRDPAASWSSAAAAPPAVPAAREPFASTGAPVRPAADRAPVRCDWRRPCGPAPAVMQADAQLRQAYSAAASARVNPHILEAFRRNWAEMRYALSDEPLQLLSGYRQLTVSLWQARRSALSGQDRRPVYDDFERGHDGPPE